MGDLSHTLVKEIKDWNIGIVRNIKLPREKEEISEN